MPAPLNPNPVRSSGAHQDVAAAGVQERAPRKQHAKCPEPQALTLMRLGARTRMWMQLAYRNVPPENSTHSAMPASDDSTGAAASSPYVAAAATGEAAAKSTSARRARGFCHLAAARYVARPKATGACANILCSRSSARVPSFGRLLKVGRNGARRPQQHKLALCVQRGLDTLTAAAILTKQLQPAGDPVHKSPICITSRPQP